MKYILINPLALPFMQSPYLSHKFSSKWRLNARHTSIKYQGFYISKYLDIANSFLNNKSRRPYYCLHQTLSGTCVIKKDNWTSETWSWGLNVASKSILDQWPVGPPPLPVPVHIIPLSLISSNVITQDYYPSLVQLSLRIAPENHQDSLVSSKY